PPTTTTSACPTKASATTISAPSSRACYHLRDTHFSWIGAYDDHGPFYYRIYSPVVLIEFDHQPGIVYANDEPTRDHIHTVVRTPNGNDYGKDLLRQHYARHDHSQPRSAHRLGKE